MIELNLVNNEFLRQFEVKLENQLARIEYSEQERKIFLTKISIPDSIYNKKLEEAFIVKVLEFIENKNFSFNKNKILNSRNKIKYFSNVKKIYPLIVKPNFGCSTKDIYSKVRKFDKAKFGKGAKKMFDINFLKDMKNSLETVAFLKYPRLKNIKLYRIN